MSLRLTASVAAGKAATALSRRLGAGAGSNFPGRVVLGIEPRALQRMAAELPRGNVVVSGTNGKTTTSNMLAAILREAGLHPVHNRAGANLLSGITAALAQGSDLRGRPRGDIGLFEVDEATLPAALERLQPRLVVVTNLFRDQLDRYGELESLGRKMSRGIAELAGRRTDALLLLNADDPLVATLGEEGGLSGVSFFGIEHEGYGTRGLEHASDSTHCRVCGALLHYSTTFFGHMGKYACPNCGAARPRPDFAASSLQMRGVEGSSVTVASPLGSFEIEVRVPGLYNVHNALAAAGAAALLGIEPAIIQRGLSGFSTAFGRSERIQARGREIVLVLSKNPAGFNEVIRTVSEAGGKLRLLLALNDLIADGRDISWIWDVDFENLAAVAGSVTATGLRAWDMGLRMKYAGTPAGEIRVIEDMGEALDQALEDTEPQGTLFALTTYTATLKLRDEMLRRGFVKPFWREEAAR
ncbi:MAG: MurT ligase domain-containing protein [Candidatus Geothermincolia bacterium]